MALTAAELALPIGYRSTTIWTEAEPSSNLGEIPAAFVAGVDRDGNEMYAVLTNPQVFNAMNACSVSAWVSRCRDDGLRFALMDPGELREAERPESLAG